MGLSEAKIASFARLTGDHNPLHFDDSFARQMGFEGRIAHGMLVSSIVSALIGEELPGKGAIFIEQRLRYRAPTYPKDTIIAELKVTAVRQDKPIITLAVRIWKPDGTVVVEGQAKVLLREPRDLEPIARKVDAQVKEWQLSGVDFSYLLAVPCPACHAGIGRICRTYSRSTRGPRDRAITHKRAGWPHFERRKAYVGGMGRG